MNMVNVVLIGFAVVSVPAFVFCLMLMQGTREELKKMTELNETGIEVQARLVSLVPFGTKGYAHALYEFEGPNGETVRHQKGATAGPAHVVGDTYPLVHHPQRTNRLHMGTKKTVRKERRMQAGYMRNAQWMALISLVAGALAIVGFVLSP
ncbi:hypothetical protein [Streptomyces sp. NPDC018000]|uniref:hypothetical protein n=1 Tax=Streptomyces sp. NPDC018000 TaxID=3365028 RepID=UPI00378A8944